MRLSDGQHVSSRYLHGVRDSLASFKTENFCLPTDHFRSCSLFEIVISEMRGLIRLQSITEDTCRNCARTPFKRHARICVLLLINSNTFRLQVAGGWRTTLMELLHNLHFSIGVVRTIRMRWFKHVACIMRTATKIFVEISEGKIPDMR
jgi:hypothetical protein